VRKMERRSSPPRARELRAGWGETEGPLEHWRSYAGASGARKAGREDLREMGGKGKMGLFRTHKTTAHDVFTPHPRFFANLQGSSCS
jgi:hypothetical protein